MAASRRPQAPLDAYVLHAYDWSETSLILDLYTRARGRVAVAAKGAKRPYSQLRSVLLPFQRVAVTLARQDDAAPAEVATLRGAEWAGGAAVLPAARLFAGFYLNELLLKMLARDDPHPALFDAYARALQWLAAAGDALEQVALRAFELVLLREIGLLPELDRLTATQAPLDPELRRPLYRLHGERGVAPAETGTAGALSAAELVALELALRAGDLDAVHATCRSCVDRLRPALRGLLDYHLGTPALRTRDVMREARQLADRR